MGNKFQWRPGIRERFPDVLSPEAIQALSALAPLNRERLALMAARAARRRERAARGERIGFLDPGALIPGTGLTAADARAGNFDGGDIPADLARQWIQGTGPATRPRSDLRQALRNPAYALLSGADGWMFDGEDALGQVDAMALDNQRSLRLAVARDPLFLEVAEDVAGEMNRWAEGFFGRPIIEDWRRQLEFTTVLYRPRGLHLDDRHLREPDGTGFSASITDLVLYVVANQAKLHAAGRTVALYLPKIQTAEEAAFWNRLLLALEGHLGLAAGTLRCYVLVEQLEQCFQLMEIRAALAPRFVGFNTGRWDYINSVADALAWDPDFLNPDIDRITMGYGYMRAYEDRVRRACATPDRNGRRALWQGGMEANIPVGSRAGVDAGMARAVAGGGAASSSPEPSGKWVAHWKMVHIVRPVWERAGEPNQLGRTFPPLGYGPGDAAALTLLEPAPRTVRGVRDLLSVGLQYGKRLPARVPGGRPEAGRLLRRRRRALPHGGHGHRRDPPVGPLGVAAQGGRLHRGGAGPGGAGPATPSPRSCACAWRRRNTASCRKPAAGTCTTIPSTPPCPSPAPSSRPTWPAPPSRPGTSTC